MRNLIWSFVAGFALLVFPVTGCGGSTSEGGAGEGGSGGMAGAGGGGTGGSGGTANLDAGLWVGGGQGGADGDFTICFHVSPDGSQLVSPVNPSTECGDYSISVQFDNENCVGGFSETGAVDIVDGTFELLRTEGGLAGYWDITGTFDGNTASGDAEIGAVPDGTCSGSWTASPSP